MPTADGVVATPRARRYLAQLCRHADRVHARPSHRPLHGADAPHVRHVEWTDTDGLVRLDAGVCTLRATPDALLLHLDAADDDALRSAGRQPDSGWASSTQMVLPWSYSVTSHCRASPATMSSPSGW